MFSLIITRSYLIQNPTLLLLAQQNTEQSILKKRFRWNSLSFDTTPLLPWYKIIIIPPSLQISNHYFDTPAFFTYLQTISTTFHKIYFNISSSWHLKYKLGLFSKVVSLKRFILTFYQHTIDVSYLTRWY